MQIYFFHILLDFPETSNPLTPLLPLPHFLSTTPFVILKYPSPDPKGLHYSCAYPQARHCFAAPFPQISSRESL